MSYARSVSIQRAAERKVGNSPCYGCAERYEACAGHCEKYKAWKSEYMEYMRKLTQKDLGANLAEDTRIKSLARIGNAKRRGSKID